MIETPTKFPLERPLVVVIACDTFPPDVNGAARFAERLSGGLQRRGHEVHVIAPSTNKRYGSYREVHDGVPIVVHRLKSYRIPQHKFLRFASPIGLGKKLRILLERINPDAVHIQSHLNVGRFAAKQAKSLRLRVIATNHTMPENLIKYAPFVPTWLEPLVMRLAWLDAYRVLRLAEAVTTPTQKAADILIDATPIEKVLAISCGIDAKQFASAAEVSRDRANVLYVGRLDYEKRVHVLIEAVSQLPRDLEVRLEIVGDGSERQSLETWAGQLKIQDRVSFLGQIPDSELPGAFERATVFVMPSIAELQSIATLEAMASGRPVIAANAAALPHLVHEGDNGYLFEPDSADDLERRLRQVLSLPITELQAMGRASLHLVQSHDIEKTIERFEQIYCGNFAQVLPTDDNLGTYTRPIDLTSAQLAALQRLRDSARNLRSRARSGVLERLNDVRGEAIEKFGELGFEVLERSKKVGKNLDRRVRKALKRFRRDDR
ncbi:MAG: glycosyltransferase [Microbacteriaceae bacterium]